MSQKPAISSDFRADFAALETQIIRARASLQVQSAHLGSLAAAPRVAPQPSIILGIATLVVTLVTALFLF